MDDLFTKEIRCYNCNRLEGIECKLNNLWLQQNNLFKETEQCDDTLAILIEEAQQDCFKNSVDWRKRCLVAEEQRDFYEEEWETACKSRMQFYTKMLELQVEVDELKDRFSKVYFDEL